MEQGTWEVVQGDKLSKAYCHLKFPSISMDHTYGSEYGNYVHLKTGSMQSGKIAKLESPELNQINVDGDCFQFWYFLHGR